MSNKVRGHIRKKIKGLVKILDAANIDWELVQAGNHPKLRFTVHGRTRTMPFSASPSDAHSERNKVALLKRMIRGTA